MATAKQIMDKAISFIGTKEKPANSNNVIFNTHYYGKAVSGSAYKWCAVFVWDVFRLCGASKLFYDGKKCAYCPSIKNWAIKNKLTVKKSKAKYGDVVIFDWTRDGVPDHIGFIESVDKNGVYHTVEGNTAIGNDSNGGAVMRRTRLANSICCVFRPKYDGKKSKEIATDKSTANSKSYMGNQNYYLNNSRVGKWQAAMNKGFDTKELTVDNKFGADSQAFASTHILSAKQPHNCITAINWLRKILRDEYGYKALPATGAWDTTLTKYVKQFQKSVGEKQDGAVGLITTYHLLKGKTKK